MEAHTLILQMDKLPEQKVPNFTKKLWKVTSNDIIAEKGRTLGIKCFFLWNLWNAGLKTLLSPLPTLHP